MKRCPACGRTFTNNTLTDCLNDGTPLVEDVPDTVSYYGAPLPASSEPLSSSYPEEAPPAPASSEPPPNYAAPPVNYAAPPPYFAAPQTSGPRVPWRRIALVCFVILGIVRLGLHAVQNQQTPPSLIGGTPATAPINTPDTMPDIMPGLKLDKTLTETPDTALRRSLIAAVKNADAAEAKSFGRLDAAPLHSFYDGPALAAELGGLKALQKAGTTKEERLTAQKFHTFQVNPAHTKAEVDEIETWNTLIRSAASGKVTKNPSDVNPQIVSLKRTAHGWVIENIQFYGLQ